MANQALPHIHNNYTYLTLAYICYIYLMAPTL